MNIKRDKNSFTILRRGKEMLEPKSDFLDAWKPCPPFLWARGGRKREESVHEERGLAQQNIPSPISVLNMSALPPESAHQAVVLLVLLWRTEAAGRVRQQHEEPCSGLTILCVLLGYWPAQTFIFLSGKTHVVQIVHVKVLGRVPLPSDKRSVQPTASH